MGQLNDRKHVDEIEKQLHVGHIRRFSTFKLSECRGRHNSMKEGVGHVMSSSRENYNVTDSLEAARVKCSTGRQGPLPGVRPGSWRRRR
jgi:hypothetical protein